MKFVSPRRDVPTLLLVVHDKLGVLKGSSYEEFLALVDSVGLSGSVVHSLNLTKINPRYLFGKGQVEKLAELLAQHKSGQLLLNVDLAPRHYKELERSLKVLVFDRTAVILDIFVQRARTYEGSIQVELAQLEYTAARLVKGWTHLERQRSGQGLRGGPGEKQLELDRRLLSTRSKQLKRRLEKVRKQRLLSRAARKKAGLPTVSLVGYTNAGKSTLFNRLTNSAAYNSAKLFATLDPTIRKVATKGARDFLLADTVGFIESLSDELLQSFAATFGEINAARLLLHIVDVSDARAAEKVRTVNETLKELGCADIRTIMVYNKVDMISSSFPDVRYDANGMAEVVWISAHSRKNLEVLLASIRAYLDFGGVLPAPAAAAVTKTYN